MNFGGVFCGHDVGGDSECFGSLALDPLTALSMKTAGANGTLVPVPSLAIGALIAFVIAMIAVHFSGGHGRAWIEAERRPD